MTLEIIKKILEKYPQERENLVIALQKIQKELGYVSKDLMEKVAEYFKVTPGEVYSIVTFYKVFRRHPPGKYPINVCLGTACYLMGGELILSAFERELNIKLGETTPDGIFSLDKSACFGCCTVAPVVKIKNEIYPKMTPAKVEEVIVNLKDKLIAKRGHR
jgi:NADH-quinone oxidoreductase subunit E